jgi:hypothetical protein
MQKKYFVVWILVCLVAVQGVLGFSVSAVTMNPSGDLVAGTPVTVTFDIPCKDVRLYDQLVIATDLNDPVWDTRTVIKDKEIAVPSAFIRGNTLTIPGAVFNLQAGVQGAVHIRLDGTMPWDLSAGRNLLHIRQLDADGTEYAYPAGFDLPMPLPPATTPVSTPTEPEPVTTIPAQTTQAPSFAELIADQPTYSSFAELIAAGTSAVPSGSPAPVSKNQTRSVPTSWAEEPPATASPVDPVTALGALGSILYIVKRSGSG